MQGASAVCLAVLLLHGCAHHGGETTVAPAYRPHSENASAFLKSLDTATIAVYPSIVRTFEGTLYSVQSQQQIVSLLNEKRITTVVAESGSVAPGLQLSNIQWDMFQSDMRAIAEQLKIRKSAAQYSLVMEFLVGQGVGGIHCYIFDRHGENAFSFLLNSHHRLFADAKLEAADTSEASRAKLIEKATSVGVKALVQQVEAPGRQESSGRQGSTISTQIISAFDRKVKRVFAIARIQERLVPVFMHSFKHSLESALESNGVDAIVKLAPRDSDFHAKFGDEIGSFAPDATMLIDLDPLYRMHRDGREAVVGTEFDVSLVNRATGSLAWQASGKVDYISDYYFKRREYTAHEGIRKEFAWHTTAAIVRAFTAEINGHESTPIYTVTEDRQIHGQRTD
jgi:hypothetical protein